MKTIEYYNNESKDLILKYDKANMILLHNLLLKYIPKQSTILDIGFGSGRDLSFLKDNNYDIWGIDPSKKFLKHIQEKFPLIKEHFILGSVPFTQTSLKLSRQFNAVIVIAMWMHLKHSQYEDVVESIVSVLTDTSTVIISYSEGSRIDDERYFEDVDLDYITKLFTSKGFVLIEIVTNKDSLNRDKLIWNTVIYKHG